MIFFIDPMSFNNLATYDFSLLSNFKNARGYFFCSEKYDLGRPSGFKLKCIYRYSGLVTPLKIISYLVSQLILLTYVLIKQPTTIHCQWIKVPLLDYHLYSLLKLIFPKIKLVFTAHNLLPHDTGIKYFSIYKKIYSRFDSIIVHHSSTKADLISKFSVKNEKINVIKHGVLDNYCFVRNESSNIESTSIKRDKKMFTIGFLGSIKSYKGIDLLLKTWIEKRNEFYNNNIRLIIAGYGEIFGLNNFVDDPDLIIVNKKLSDNDFLYFLNQCDCIVFPYRKISQSGLLFTAINEEIPVIVFNIGGLSEPLKFGRIGEIFEEYTVNGFYTAIERFLSNYKTDMYHSSEFSKVKKEYSWESISFETEKLYLLNE